MLYQQQKETQDAYMEEFATKKDLTNELQILEQRLLLRLGSLIVAMTGLILAVMQLGGA